MSADDPTRNGDVETSRSFRTPPPGYPPAHWTISPIDVGQYTGLAPIFEIVRYDETAQWVSAKQDVNDKFATLQGIWKGPKTKWFHPLPRFIWQHFVADPWRHANPRTQANLKTGFELNLAAILRLQWFNTLVFATLIFELALAWFAFNRGGLLMEGNLTLLPGSFEQRLVDFVGPFNGYLIFGNMIWTLILLIFVEALRYHRIDRVQKASDAIDEYYDKEVYGHWLDDLQHILSRMGDGDRNDVAQNTATRSYHALMIWRRIERLAARVEPLWSDFRDDNFIQYSNANPVIAFARWFLSGIFILLIVTSSMQEQALAGQLSYDMVEPFLPMMAFAVLVVSLIPVTVVFLRLRRQAKESADKLESAIKNLSVEEVKRRIEVKKKGGAVGLSDREEKYAHLDPIPALIERYRSALDDLKITMG